MRRTWHRNSATLSRSSARSAFLTTGCRLNASSTGPVAAHTKSGPRMPASQKSRRRSTMCSCISASTLPSQPGRAVAGRFLQTSQMEEERRAPPATLFCISVRIGQEPSTTKPARINADTSVSQAEGCLLANTTTSRPFSLSAFRQF